MIETSCVERKEEWVPIGPKKLGRTELRCIHCTIEKGEGGTNESAAPPSTSSGCRNLYPEQKSRPPAGAEPTRPNLSGRVSEHLGSPGGPKRAHKNVNLP